MTRVAVCQLEGRVLEQADESLEACRGLVTEAAAAGAEVVVLPEGSYPAYVLGSAERARVVMAEGPDPLDAFGQMARDHAVVMVVGVVLEGPSGLYNSAVTFGPDGAPLARTHKRFLWHFDQRWFVPGDQSPVVELPFGHMGALVCADARLPEISRGMATRGAGLVCDPTAWVTSTPGAPHNIQPDFLVAARCVENGIVMACASKSGFEGPTVAYAGRSMIVGPDGSILSEAPDRGEVVVTADVDLTGLPRPPVARHPQRYQPLLESWEVHPPSRLRVRLGAANHAPVAPTVMKHLETEDVALVVTEEMEADPSWEPRQTEAGRMVCLARDDVLAPEPARIAALRGAEVLAVVERGVPLTILRARAAENRVFVAAAGDPALVISPRGAVIADAPPVSVRPFVCAADCVLAEAAVKEMAPGSDVFAGRQPDTYADLVAG